MIISVVNHTSGKIGDEEVQAALRAINRQIAEDFEPYWSMGARLRLEGRSGTDPDAVKAADLRGEAILYLWDGADVDEAIGYHERNARGIPFGFVFTEISRELGEPWTVTLSHEVLEMIADPEVNLLVKGPHPDESIDREVFHWYEMCDAVQAETYSIDDIEVSNFLLPLYFTGGEEVGGRNDFLGRLHDGRSLESFGVNPGGYVGFYDPETNEHATYSHAGDGVAAKRMDIKGALGLSRRSNRYQTEAPTCAARKRLSAKRRRARARAAAKRTAKKGAKAKPAPRKAGAKSQPARKRKAKGRPTRR